MPPPCSHFWKLSDVGYAKKRELFCLQHEVCLILVEDDGTGGRHKPVLSLTNPFCVIKILTRRHKDCHQTMVRASESKLTSYLIQL